MGTTPEGAGPDSPPEAASARKPPAARNPAVWGLAGALLGGVVTGTFSLIGVAVSAERAADTARQGHAAEAQRARADFLRSERLKHYEEVLATSQRLTDACTSYAYMLQYRQSYTQPALDTALAELHTAFKAYVTAAWAIRVIGSDAVAQANDELSSKMDEAAYKLFNYRGVDSELQDVAAYFGTFPQEAFDLRVVFSQAAQGEFRQDAQAS
ncbi:hypothetical protein [Arthrobacter mobilis]|uniref:Uncharacterized protein n=1 Tax=Arthrobacter mobilis TaxID=2724944 RepID=A0A7X6K4A0_9MICC|nr:hypothetical protein [Arthrobacter mobilis]NKX52989.1 hypothetical protein [Arthrobacter mobilis]